jgi:hypothetical protein
MAELRQSAAQAARSTSSVARPMAGWRSSTSNGDLLRPNSSNRHFVLVEGRARRERRARLSADAAAQAEVQDRERCVLVEGRRERRAPFRRCRCGRGAGRVSTLVVKLKQMPLQVQTAA